MNTKKELRDFLKFLEKIENLDEKEFKEFLKAKKKIEQKNE